EDGVIKGCSVATTVRVPGNFRGGNTLHLYQDRGLDGLSREVYPFLWFGL
ncbi:unnamed protein product, partial [Ectocarpus sp. 6 AP-2014]